MSFLRVIFQRKITKKNEFFSLKFENTKGKKKRENQPWCDNI